MTTGGSLPINAMFDGALSLERDHGKANIVHTLVIKETLDRLAHHVGKLARSASGLANHPTPLEQVHMGPDEETYELSILAGNLNDQHTFQPKRMVPGRRTYQPCTPTTTTRFTFLQPSSALPLARPSRLGRSAPTFRPSFRPLVSFGSPSAFSSFFGSVPDTGYT